MLTCIAHQNLILDSCLSKVGEPANFARCGNQERVETRGGCRIGYSRDFKEQSFNLIKRHWSLRGRTAWWCARFRAPPSAARIRAGAVEQVNGDARRPKRVTAMLVAIPACTARRTIIRRASRRAIRESVKRFAATTARVRNNGEALSSSPPASMRNADENRRRDNVQQMWPAFRAACRFFV